MKKRRPLSAGLPSKPLDPHTEAAFITGQTPSTPPKPIPAPEASPKAEKRTAEPEPPAAPVQPNRSPLTTRLRADLAEALKRASLERQLAKVTPNTVQDILEEALEPWLERHGYLK